MGGDERKAGCDGAFSCFAAVITPTAIMKSASNVPGDGNSPKTAVESNVTDTGTSAIIDAAALGPRITTARLKEKTATTLISIP
jgi:hypothetical protein